MKLCLGERTPLLCTRAITLQAIPLQSSHCAINQEACNIWVIPSIAMLLKSNCFLIILTSMVHVCLAFVVNVFMKKS